MPDPPAQITCPSCGTVLSVSAKFCGQCGTRIGSASVGTGGGARAVNTMTIPNIPAQRSATPTHARVEAGVDPARNPATPHEGTAPASPVAGDQAATVALSALRRGTPGMMLKTDPADPMVGRVIENRFRVLERLGVGGMGTVYRARHEHMQKTLAIKVLNPTLSADPVVRARFRREARAASLLESPHTVAVFDFGETADGLLFLAMELLRGKTLAEVLRVESVLTPQRAFRILGQVLRSLEEAHANGIVHRDIKPENIFLVDGREGDFAKVLDFGIAKGERIAEPNGPGMGPQTRGDLVVGTPEYMAPEQARGQQVDGRADVWAVGVVLYECMVGRLPFQGDTPVDTLVALMERTLPPPAAGTIHPAAWRVVEHALQKKAQNRYASAAAMRAAMDEALLVMTQVPSVPPAPVMAPAAQDPASDDDEGMDRDAWGEFERSQRTRRTLTSLALVALVGAGAVGAWRMVEPAGPATAEQEPNDKAVAATPVAPGVVMTGVLAEPREGRKDQDYFVMELAEGPQVLSARVSPSSPTPVTLGLSAWVDNKLVFKGYGARVTHPEIDNLTVQGRMLYVMVREERAGTTANQVPATADVPYTLTIKPLRAPSPSEEREPNDDPADATPLPRGQAVSALLSPGDDEDHFRAQPAPEDEDLEIDVVPARGVAVDVELLGADGKRVVRKRGRAGERVTQKAPARRCGGACLVHVTGELEGQGEPAYQVTHR